MKLAKEELFNIVGGSITASMLNAVTKLISTTYSFGQSVGSTFRRLVYKNWC